MGLNTLIIFSVICQRAGWLVSASASSLLEIRSLRLTNGSVVSAEDIGANKFISASMAVGVTDDNGTCIGVMTSRTQFTTGCDTFFLITRVFVGSPFFPSFPTESDTNFNGQILKVTGLSINYLYHGYTSWPVEPIPQGSRSVPATIFPPNSPALGPESKCIAIGYGRPAAPFVLNTLPAIITDYPTCNASVGHINSRDFFCAYLLDANGGHAYCQGEDAVGVVTCRRSNVRREQFDSKRPQRALLGDSSAKASLRSLCPVGSQKPLCHFLCSWNPYCGTLGPPPEGEQFPEWVLAGFVFVDINSCGVSPRKPILFEFVTTV